MPRRKPRSGSASLRPTLLLAATTLIVFAGGEALILTRTDAWQVKAARYFGIGDKPRITQLIGRQIHQALDAAGVPRDSVRETVLEDGPAALRCRVGLAPDASLLQTNYAISQSLDRRGGVVLSGRERVGGHGETVVTLLVGLPREPTHEVVLVRAASSGPEPGAGEASLALVVYGIGEDSERASSFLRLPFPFAVALAPGAETSPALFRDARAQHRELVLHLPLEPLNYPQVNPGPGTILVTMSPARIAGLLRRYLEQSGPVSAVANHMGSLATQDATVMTAIYRELKRQRLPFLHVAPVVGAVCKPLAADLGVAYEEPDAVLDAEARMDRAKALDARWTGVLKETRARGRMVVMLRGTALVRRWLPGALSAQRLDGVSLVPLSSLLKRPAL